MLMLPTLFILGLMGFFPFGYAIFLAGRKLILSKLYLPNPFVGLANFEYVMKDPQFIHSLLITVIFTAEAVTIEFFLGLALAMLANRKIRGLGIFRVCLLIPMAITPVVTGLIWRFMLYSGAGFISYYGGRLAHVFGGTWPELLSAQLALQTLIAIDVWQWTPFMFLILLAGLSSIPPEPYEAARIDGAGTWFIFRSITLPLLKPMILIALLIRTMDAFRVFDKVFVLTAGGPGNATQSLVYYLYYSAFKFFHVSRGAALALITLIIIVAVSFFYVKLLRKEAVIR
jgi:multiple sugar transport system permease protein